MEDLVFQNIEYTPAWYYKHFPGFYNVECYNILADYSQHPEKYTKDGEGVEETKSIEEHENTFTLEESNDETNEHVNKKCKISKEEEPV
jgi:hypothetical protein